MKLLVVCGHGKKSNGTYDNGASGNGYTEAERVRVLANKIKSYGGSAVTLGDQNKKWLDYGLYNNINKGDYDAVIEIHMDAGPATAKGGHVIIKSGLSADKYDTALRDFIAGYFPGRNNTLVGRSDLGVVNTCAARGINFRLLEVCFISNAADITKFNKDVDAVAKGILAAFGIKASGSGSTSTSTPSTPATSTPTTSGKKSTSEIVEEVIAGKWGNNPSRKTKLANAGYDADAIQAAVNKKLGVGFSTSTTSGKKSLNTIAKEVAAGNWGNGNERKQRLEAAGYNYREVQNLVNKIV